MQNSSSQFCVILLHLKCVTMEPLDITPPIWEGPGIYSCIIRLNRWQHFIQTVPMALNNYPHRSCQCGLLKKKLINCWLLCNRDSRAKTGISVRLPNVKHRMRGYTAILPQHHTRQKCKREFSLLQVQITPPPKKSKDFCLLFL